MIQHLAATLSAHPIRGRVASFNLDAVISGCISLKADRASICIAGVAQNALGIGKTNGLSIRVAQSEGFIIADASGIVGFNPLEAGQRDSSARIGVDQDNQIGDSQ